MGLALGLGGAGGAWAEQPGGAEPGAAAGSASSEAQMAPPREDFMSSLKQAIALDYGREVVRGHFDVGSPPDAHRYYCLVDDRSGKRQASAVAGQPVLRADGMTGIKAGAVAFYSCASAEQQGILVTAGYVLTGAAAGAVTAASRAQKAAGVSAAPASDAAPDVAVPGTTGPESELVALTSTWADAIRTRNLAGLEALVAPGFVLLDWDGGGRITRPEWLTKYVQGYD